MPTVFAAIAPHGGMAIAEATPPERRALAATTRRAMEELGRRCAAARPDAIVVVTPHNVHVDGAMAVLVAGTLSGSVGEPPHVATLRCATDRELALAMVGALRRADVPAVGVSYGANDAGAATAPLDWGGLVPLWFMGGRAEGARTVVMAPARDLPAEAHVRAGRALGELYAASPKRVAFVASSDQAHAHQAEGPYGHHPDARAFDDLAVDIVRSGDLSRLLAIDRAMIANGKPDSWWQMLMLHGLVGDGWRGEFLSYEAPTYFGMLCAAYSPR